MTCCAAEHKIVDFNLAVVAATRWGQNAKIFMHWVHTKEPQVVRINLKPSTTQSLNPLCSLDFKLHK